MRLAIAKQELGSLDRITRVVKVVGHVASAEGFTEQPQVLNGASDLARRDLRRSGTACACRHRSRRIAASSCGRNRSDSRRVLTAA